MNVLHISQELGRDGLFAEFPDHGTQLKFVVKTDAVIDGPDTIVCTDETMAALAVGIVDHVVK